MSFQDFHQEQRSSCLGLTQFINRRCVTGHKNKKCIQISRFSLSGPISWYAVSRKSKTNLYVFHNWCPNFQWFLTHELPMLSLLVILNRSLFQCLFSLSLNPPQYLHVQYSLPKIHPWLPTPCQTNHLLWLVWIWLLLSSSPTLSSSIGRVG